jgi:hypothetical protein
MRTAKPIVLGALVGLALSLAALAGLYASPWRQEAYFRADPGLADLRSKLATYQDWLTQVDARIALQGPDADSLREEQARVWRDYKAWRTRMGELARAHAEPSGPGFVAWAYSLRYWDGPLALAAVLLGILFGFLGARNRYRPARARPGKAPRAAEPAASQAHARAMSQFEEAVKQVARISRQEAPPKPAEPPPTDLLPIQIAGETESRPKPRGPKADPREPETAPLPLDPPAEAPPQGDGRETHFFQVGPAWGESPPDARSAQPDLSMEDEDSPEPETLPGVMPPTTEVERVERRKDEVLKLARKGMTSSEISRRLRISQDQVEIIIRMRREKG